MNDKEYVNMLLDNVAVFEDTRKVSKTEYRYETIAMKQGTKVYTGKINCNCVKNSDMKIHFVHGGTVNTAYEYAKQGGRVALLNFADAKRPGGWVIDGAPTQEENICRCTNLYESLITGKCDKKYYKVNDIFHTDRHLDEAYTDNLIYSPDVLIFKDDTTYERVPEMFVDVITCPSPCGNVKNVETILVRRIQKILRSAISYRVGTIILGAWGCGAFGQSPEIVAMAFAKALKDLSCFDNVVFAIKNTPGVEDGSSTKDVFKREFILEWLR